MNIINKLYTFFPNSKKKKFLFVSKKKNLRIRDHNDNQDNIRKQKLYERWCRKENWLLHDEGILLLLSIDPKENRILETQTVEKINYLRGHAIECVKKGLLPIINKEKSELEWKVEPINLYYWATVSRIKIPEEFNAIMTFISQSVKKIKVTTDPDSDNTVNQIHKEIILGASVSLLVNSPEVCFNKQGIIDSKAIAGNIIKNKKYWFSDCEYKPSIHDISNLLNRYVNISKNIY